MSQHNGYIVYLVDGRIVNKVLAHVWRANFIDQKLKYVDGNNTRAYFPGCLLLTLKKLINWQRNCGHQRSAKLLLDQYQRHNATESTL